MKKIIAYIAAGALLAACTASTPSQSLAHAEASIARGDTASVRAICAELAAEAEALTPTELCRQAMLYAQLSELCDNADDMAAAANCLERATAINPDSVSAFLMGLNVEQLSRLSLVLGVSQALMSPIDIDSDNVINESDSIF